jgi:hypothetical protein
MACLKNFWIANLLFAALLFSAEVHATTIVEFDKLTGSEKDQCITQLVSTAEKSLVDIGRPEDAAKINQLFSKSTVGAEQFYMTLAIARVADAKNSDAPRVTIEKVLAVCLEKNDGIKLPQKFITNVSTFNPKYPPQTK